MDLYFFSVLLFFFVLGILIYKDRKNIEFKYILFLRRTKKFKKGIDKIAKKSPLFWKVIGTIAIVVCFYYMIQGVYILLIYQPSLQFVLPTPTPKGSMGPGYILIPFWFWIVVVASILVPHELFHGIIARAEKIRLKSVGLLLLAIFPGAFVEPDEKQIKKAGLLTKLRIFSAGSFANFVVSFAIFYLTSYLIWPLCTTQGILLLNVTSSSPAEIAGLKGGMVITEVNGKPIIPTYTEYLSGRGYLFDELGNVKPNQTIILKADGKLYDVKLAYNKTTNSTYMGIVYQPLLKVDSEFFLGVLIPLLTMISIFSFAVGVVNILPIYPLDGGLLIQAITEKYVKKWSEAIVKTITFFIVFLMLYGLFKSFL